MAAAATPWSSGDERRQHRLAEEERARRRHGVAETAARVCVCVCVCARARGGEGGGRIGASHGRRRVDPEALVPGEGDRLRRPVDVVAEPVAALLVHVSGPRPGEPAAGRNRRGGQRRCRAQPAPGGAGSSRFRAGRPRAAGGEAGTWHGARAMGGGRR